MNKPHKNRTQRNLLLYDIQGNLDKAKFIKKVLEIKGREIYNVYK